MTIRAHFKRFIKSNLGAVAVDWVVLSAAVVGLGGSVMVSVSDGALSLAGTTSSSIDDVIASKSAPSKQPAPVKLSKFDAMLAEYKPLYDDHQQDKEGKWASSLYDQLAKMDKKELMNRYEESYKAAMTWGPDKYTDILRVTEFRMAELGLKVPKGNIPAEELHKKYASEFL